MFFLFNGAFRLTPIQSQAVAMLQVTLRSSPLLQTERLLSFGTKVPKLHGGRLPQR